jgi:ribosome-binding ATPase
MSLQAGIVGLPNVGKSTIFNALTESGIPAENYPFCTIDPNIRIVEVPDERMVQISQWKNRRNSFIQLVNFFDIQAKY